jgi:hypothetical protein
MLLFLFGTAKSVGLLVNHGNKMTLPQKRREQWGTGLLGLCHQLIVVVSIGKYNISVVGILAECACVIRSPLHALPCQGLCCA